MNEVFNPSLVISAGPSGKKALDFLNNMLLETPEHFLNLIECCDVESIDEIKSELQEIVDNKLLSAKNLNKLVDLGYKVRNENIEGVKINIYVLWDMYSAEISASELIELIYGLNYGNVDKSQYSGVSLYIMPIAHKEWAYNEEEKLRGVNNLNTIVKFITKQENMINIDSKIYLLHSISKDGTRISKEELEYISSHLIYLNIVPSKHPSLSYFNQRILMHEGDFKVGTIGISALSVRKDKLLKEFSGYLCFDLMERAISFEKYIDYSPYDSFRNIKSSVHINELKNGVPFIDGNEPKLKSNEAIEVNLTDNIWDYPRIMKNWEGVFEQKYLGEIKKKIDKSSSDIASRAKEAINRDLNEISLSYSLKQGENFLLELLKNAEGQSTGHGTKAPKDISYLNETLKKKAYNYPNYMGFIVKIIILTSFLLYSSNNLFFPYLSMVMRIIYVVLLIGLISSLTWLDYKYKVKKFNNFIKTYIDEVYKNSGILVKQYMENKLAEVQKSIIDYINERIVEVAEGIENCKKVRSDILATAEYNDLDDENLITSLLDFKDRRRFYEAQSKDLGRIYSGLAAKLSDLKQFREEAIKETIEEYSLEASKSYIALDFYEFLKFKYGEDLNEGISSWIDKGLIKSKELLQYNNSRELERHGMFVATKGFVEATKDVLNSKLCGYEISTIDGEDIFIDSISIIKLTLGVELSSITPFMNIREGNNI
ncbi:hypothetical protein [Clostridium folliculivorans]|uniref:Uncharacterized protein n=1 Tax=Clostridium folliculivorans TaxID=2886038 RepID=A0A9W6D9I8_9CLOT|nr:hypothetical protein [Clostridium folliculivorans]GKU24179.1 hypothetical protein CFOLD11_10050 [Clostridium folliculivorans]GKU30284.1 hypothetical protein CFB3_23910 [Clostridium folliculivorans]